ncbi:12e548d1-2ac2-49c8-9571-f396a1bfd27d [Sclerotinia trifoliorum]|uniref:12e548d1-2ac2-49c8-9571-f396a1bfd27d n=1 Tax=Sclerotinia trifoliorum TaxID=28548 RepID=A0A8H2W1C4_9HELO|nr:12e548d1-2ac2-49c8-9571-f396a1bfd27d [Sclerotinia trifoliorum]
MLPLKRIPYPFPKSSAPISFSFSHSHSHSHSQIPSRYRHFASTPPNKGQNRIYSPVRYPSDLTTYISLSTSTSKPLLTLWTTSSCSTCRTISPLLHEIIENGTGEKEGGILYTEVEFDAPDLLREGLGLRYLVRSVLSLVVLEGRWVERDGGLVVGWREEGKREVE